MTVWRPDTCGCAVEYDNLGVYVKTVKACPAHALSAGSSQHLTKLLGENRLKNNVLNDISKEVGISLEPKTEAEKIALDELLKKYEYKFDATRKLVVSHPDLNVTDMDTKLKAKYGNNVEFVSKVNK